jgi:hypothetical protein
MNKRHILTAAVLAVTGFGLAALPAWAQDSAAGQSAAQAEKSAQDRAAQPSQDPAAQPSDPRTAAQPAGDRAREAAAGGSQVSQSDAGKALSQVTQAVLSQGGISNLGQSFSRQDQQRIGDLSQQAQQLDQTTQQLRQAFKDKYQKDLDMSANADQVFTSSFIQIGGAAGDRAQPAAGTVSPDAATGTGTGASGAASSGTGATGAASDPARAADTSSAGASGTASSGTGATGAAASGGLSSDLAQPAAGQVGQRATITIPASHGAKETRVSLIQEGGQWKIDVPDNLDGKQLSQNLQQHLQMAAQAKDQWPADATQAQQAIAHHVLMAFAEPAAAGQSGQRGSGAGASGGLGTSGTGSSGASGTPGGTSR